MTEASHFPSDGELPEYVKNIGNLWLLWLYALFTPGYASDQFLRLCDWNSKVDIEANPDDFPADWVAEILVYAVEERQRRQFSLGYQVRQANLNRVRGRIDVLATERRQLLLRGRVACRFHDLTVDTPRNRFVRAALETIGHRVRQHELQRRCWKLASNMKLMGVSGVPLARYARYESSFDRYGRNDADDRCMVAAAKLAFDLALPTEAPGRNALPLPDREKLWKENLFWELFERAVGGFYRVVLSSRDWNVTIPGETLTWDFKNPTSGLSEILPKMKPDIILYEKRSRRKIVIDTKLEPILKSDRYGDKKLLRSADVYKIYAYLQSKVGHGDDSADVACTKEGLLLYPKYKEDIDESATIQNHRFRFATVDLSASTSTIRKQLLRFVEPWPV